MRARAATYFTSRIAPRAVEAIQTLAGAALLTALCLLVARLVVPDLVYRGLTNQLASPVSIVGLLLLTVATVLLERELTWHGFAVGEPTGHEGARAEVRVVEDVVEVAGAISAPVAAPAVIQLPESATVAPNQESAVLEPVDALITLPETPALQLVAHADPPEPRAEPIDDDPWWMPWMDRGRRSVFDTASDGPRFDVVHRELDDSIRVDHRSDELIPAA